MFVVSVTCIVVSVTCIVVSVTCIAAFLYFHGIQAQSDLYAHCLTHHCYVVCRTAHERAHLHADERMNKLKWPWERAGAVEDVGEVDEDERHYSNKELYEKFK